MFDIRPYPRDEIRNATRGSRAPAFALKGAMPGPRLVVTGDDDVLLAVADALWDVPGLIAMRGSIELRMEGTQSTRGLADDVLNLEAGLSGDQGRRRVLGRMTSLGMIQGRGVPIRWVA